MVNETTNVSLFLFQNAFLYFSKYRHSLDVTDRFGWRCLHSASYIGYLPIVQYLIEKGANIEAKDENQWTPLHIACFKGFLPIVQYLIEKGANIEAKDRDQNTPLHIASSYGKTDVVKYLVSKGANKKAKNKDGLFGKTPRDIARNDEIRELLK